MPKICGRGRGNDDAGDNLYPLDLSNGDSSSFPDEPVPHFGKLNHERCTMKNTKGTLRKIRDYSADRLMQWGIGSSIIGVVNFAMISGLYLNSVGMSKWLTPLFIGCILLFNWILGRAGFIRALFLKQHLESPILMEILENQKVIMKKLDIDEGVSND